MGANKSKLRKKLDNSLNELINRSDLDVRFTNLSIESLKTLETIKDCASCKDKEVYFDEIYKSINRIEKLLIELEKGKQQKDHMTNKLYDELIKINDLLNINLSCE